MNIKNSDPMKKQILLLALFILLGFSKANCQTQAPDWVWAKSAQFDSAGGGEGLRVATDIANNVYITGYYSASIIFGSFILMTTASNSFYLAKYDAAGNVKWAKSATNSSLGSSRGFSVWKDIFDNVFAVGYFQDTVSFGSDTLVSNGSADIFIVKYDTSGNVLWAKNAGGTSDDIGYGVSGDRVGNAYITGIFQSPIITFDSFTLNNAGGADIFIAKYDFSGNVLWAKSVGSTGDDEGYSIATDALANVYVTGFFDSPTITCGSYTLTNVGNHDVFLAKYDSSGNVMWATSAGGTDDDEGFYVATDPSGNAYITGYYASQYIIFDSYILNNTGGDNSFLVKYDSSGNVVWLKNIGGAGTEKGYCIAMDGSNKVCVTGGFTSALLSFDTITVQQPAVFNDPMFIAEYDSSGHALWVKALGSGGDDNSGVTSSPSGCLYIGGDFETLNSFIIGNDSLHLSGGEDVFVAKLCYSDSGQGISEISTTKEFILYPNPFEDEFTVAASPPGPLKGEMAANSPLGGGGEFILFDVFGQVLLRRSFINSATINTEQLARGMYFYEIRDKDGVGARGKAVKQ